MDTLDTNILRELFRSPGQSPLQQDPRKSYRAIARLLQVDEGTVRKRVKKLQYSGFLKGTRIILHPDLLGIRATQIFFDVPPGSSKSAIIEKVRLIPGVVIISDCFGNTLYVMFYSEGPGDSDDIVRLITRIAEARNVLRLDLKFPPCKIPLTETDWRIALNLHETPRKAHSALARELGVSGRTVKRRIRRMIENGALLGMPVLDYRRLHGIVHTDLVLFYRNRKGNEELKNKVVNYLGEFLLYAELTSDDYAFFALHIPNISKAEEIQAWVRRQRGVKLVRIALLQDRLENYRFLADLMHRRLQALPKSRGPRD